MFDDDEIIRALDLSAKSSSVDTQIHLHSPLHYNIACESDSINVVGVESAANPDYLELVEKADLEQYDMFLRVGVARTDIFGMTAELNERYQINVWKETSMLNEIVTSMETPDVVAKRLKRASGLEIQSDTQDLIAGLVHGSIRILHKSSSQTLVAAFPCSKKVYRNEQGSLRHPRSG
jgi:5-methyltetrahydropteroyltriglutamate--homocysteine methyltransferase